MNTCAQSTEKKRMQFSKEVPGAPDVPGYGKVSLALVSTLSFPLFNIILLSIPGFPLLYIDGIGFGWGVDGFASQCPDFFLLPFQIGLRTSHLPHF